MGKAGAKLLQRLKASLRNLMVAAIRKGEEAAAAGEEEEAEVAAAAEVAVAVRLRV